jgi:hypothetical protein
MVIRGKYVYCGGENIPVVFFVIYCVNEEKGGKGKMQNAWF